MKYTFFLCGGGGHVRLLEIRLHSWVISYLSFIEKGCERGG